MQCKGGPNDLFLSWHCKFAKLSLEKAGVFYYQIIDSLFDNTEPLKFPLQRMTQTFDALITVNLELNFYVGHLED